MLAVAGCGLTIILLLVGLRVWTEQQYRTRIYERTADVPPHPVAIVLGAGVWADGSLTPVAADRVATAVELYHTGTVRKLLISGDNRFVHYNEPQRMQEYAISLGMPAENIVLDYAGRRTYDTCYRARAIFGMTEAVIVTQRFHVARALYLCDALSIDAVAAVADRRVYSRQRYVWEAREYLALANAWWDVHIGHPVPVLGQPEPMDLTSDSDGN